MKPARYFLPLLAMLALPLSAQVPQMLNYQGRVAVGATHFQGTGQFKFALVNADGSTRYWTNSPDVAPADGVPDQSVSLPVNQGLYSLLLGDTAVLNMAPIPTSVFDQSDVRVRVWFNDGTQGFQWLTPDQRIAAVGYAVMAGNVADGAITGAKIGVGAVNANHLSANSVTGDKIASGAVDGSHLAAGAVGAGQLAGGSAAARLQADGQGVLPGGGLVFSAIDDNPELIAAGYVKLGKTDLGVQESVPFGTPPDARTDPFTIWTGSEMIVWGGILANGQSTNGGAKYNPATNTWTAVASAGAPTARSFATAVWSGSEMIVWGGTSDGFTPVATGARYSPSANTWSTTAAPPGVPVTPWGYALSSGRFGHTAVWIGSAMIVWGGSDGYDNQGQNLSGVAGIYDPSSNQWGVTDSADIDREGRMFPTSVVVQNKVYFIGGRNLPSGGSLIGDVVTYDFENGEWATLPGIPPVDLARESFVATAIAGERLLVWGGRSAAGTALATGAVYLVAKDLWETLPALNAPSPRWNATSVWTGNHWIVWGGGTATERLSTGARYDPEAGAWTPLATAEAPSARQQHGAIWTGVEIMVFGGTTTGASAGAVAIGASYHPAVDLWRPTGGNGRPRIMTLYLRP